MFQLPHQLILILAILTLTITLKPSEVGVNDWAINSLGELRDLTFSKNKIYFVSHLSSIGILDKYSGSVEARALMAESQKVVGFGDMTMTIATRYNQVVSHFITATGLDKKANNNFKVDNRTVQWITRFDQNDYFITKSSLHHAKDIIREAQSDQVYLRLAQGTTLAGNVVFLLYKINSQNNYCIESYLNGFLNKYCVNIQTQELLDLQFYEGYVILSFAQSTYILTENLELVVSFDQRLAQLANKAVVLTSHSFSLKDKKNLQKRPIKSSRKDAEVSIIQQEAGIRIFRDDIELFFISSIKKNIPLKGWLNFKSQMDFDLVLQYSDLQLVCYTVSRSDVQIAWTREQSLAYVEDVVFMKYHQMDTLDNEYHRHLLDHSYRGLTIVDKLSQVPKDLFLRLQEEITDIKHFIFQSINYLMLHLGSINQASIRKFEMPPEQEIKHGLRKYIIFLTKFNTLVAIDTKTHQILWKINRDTHSRMIKFVHLKRDYETEVAVIISHSSASSQTFIEEISQQGQVKLLETYSSEHEPYIYKLNDHNIAIKFGAKIEKFCLFKQDDLKEKQFYFYTQDKNSINGWKAVDDSVEKIWNFQTKGSEQIVKVASAFRGDQTSHIPLFDREKVFFKNVDFTNLAVLTSFNRTDVALYIINGRTGKVHYNSFKNSISLNMPINLVYDQNSVLISYFNHKSKNFEIWAVEQYQERIETSALNMISDYISGNTYKPQESRERTIFQDEVYGSSVYIKHLYVSQSKMSLTRRNLFIITRQNQLYTINRDLVSTRRPKKDVKSFFANDKFPEYTYFLPFLPSSFLSYHLTLANLNKIQFSPTDMESTIFTLSYGTDLFMIRNAPDKTFDMITQDFNHVVLILILIAATVGIIAFKRILNAAKLKKAHLE